MVMPAAEAGLQRGTLVMPAASQSVSCSSCWLKLTRYPARSLLPLQLYLLCLWSLSFIPFLRKLITDKAETPIVEAATVVPVAWTPRYRGKAKVDLQSLVLRAPPRPDSEWHLRVERNGGSRFFAW